MSWDEVFPEPTPTAPRLVTRRRLLAAAAVAALAAAIWAIAWLATYDPLEHGMLMSSPTGSLQSSTVNTRVSDPIYFFNAERPGTAGIGFDITNSGRLPVRIEGLASPSAFDGLRMGRYPMYESPNHSATSSIVPFEPVTIEPGASRYFVLELTVTEATACTPSRGAQTGTASDPRLRYSYLGVFRRTATVEVPFTVVTVCGGLPPSYDALGG